MTAPLDDALAAIQAVREAESGKPRFSLVRASSVQSVRVQFVWDGRLPLGKLVAIEGPAGVGKTTVAMDLIARATRGGPMPGSDTCFEPMNVIIVAAEDGWADTIKPRLEVAGADMDRVFFLIAGAGDELSLPHDTDRLAHMIDQVNATMVHIEAIMAVLADGVSANSDKEVRRALGPLKDMANAKGVLVTFIRHPRKSGALRAIDAGGGSVAISALTRSLLFVDYDPTDHQDAGDSRRRVLASGKSNLGPTPKSLTFQLLGTENGHAAVEWGGESEVTADELAAAPMLESRLRPSAPVAKVRDPSPAEAMLTSILADGKNVPFGEIKQAAEERNLVERNVQRAADRLGVQKVRVGTYPATTYWFLPLESPVMTEPAALRVP